MCIGAANGVRYIAAGGGEAPDPAERLNNIEFVTISNGGSSQDFGDLTSKKSKVLQGIQTLTVD